MTLIRTSLLNGIAVTIRMATAVLLNKILAIYVGPGGFAIIGQFQNAVSVAIAFAAGAINTGVTKYTAEYYDDNERQRSLWRTAGTIALGGSLLVALGIALFRKSLAQFFLGDVSLSGVLLWLAAGLMLYALNALLLAILNGKKELRRYITSNIVGSFLGLALTGVLAWRWGLYGALVALSINQSIICFVTLYLCRRTSWFRIGALLGRIDPVHAKNLGKFMLMAATTAVVVPTSHILVRNHLAVEFGWNYAGYWDAMWKISTLSLTLVTTTLSLYYLPRISEIREWKELRMEILRGYRIILPIVTVSAGVLYLFREFVVLTLFTSEFLPMLDLFAWQLAGDVVKIASWLIAYIMIGRAMTVWFIITEVIASAGFWLFTLLFTSLVGFEGVAISHLVNYALYLVMMFMLIFRKRIQ